MGAKAVKEELESKYNILINYQTVYYGTKRAANKLFAEEGYWPLEKLAVCTDACKGLEATVKAVFPMCEQRECFRHLMENMKKYFSGDVYGKNMWPAARAYAPHKFKYIFDKVVDASPQVVTWLREHHNLLWARSKFSADIKCDYINNNLAESWNAWIKECKATRQVKCDVCCDYGHRRGSWRCALTGTKKRKRTKKTTTKPGRKKSKKDQSTVDGQCTPRTRAAVAREEAAKAQREAHKAAARAAAALQIAEAASREARNISAHQDIIPLPTEFTAPSTPTRTRRTLSTELEAVAEEQGPSGVAARKITPRKKKISTKVKKTPPSKAK